MILPFKTKFDNGEPTYFPEKIYFAICKEVATGNNPELLEKLVMFFNDGGSSIVEKDFWHKEYFENLTQGKPHTIRADKKNRWRLGNLIHFYINNRTKNALQFAPVLRCTGVQKIWIYHSKGHISVYIDEELYGEVFHHGFDDIYDYTDDLLKLAQNDGFKDLESFFDWFNTDFEGKIIHWTDLRY